MQGLWFFSFAWEPPGRYSTASLNVVCLFFPFLKKKVKHAVACCRSVEDSAGLEHTNYTDLGPFSPGTGPPGFFRRGTHSLNPIFSTEGALVAKIRVGELGGQSYSPFHVHFDMQS
jgi:hypothetical protein